MSKQQNAASANGTKPSTDNPAKTTKRPAPNPPTNPPTTTNASNSQSANNNAVNAQNSVAPKVAVAATNNNVLKTEIVVKTEIMAPAGNAASETTTVANATVIANSNTSNSTATNKDSKTKPRGMISMKQIASKAAKTSSLDHETKTEETLLSERPKPERKESLLSDKIRPPERKESLQVLVVPPDGERPKNFRSNSRLSVSSRRLSVESHRSLDFNPMPSSNGAAPSAPLPAEVDDKYLLLQSADDSYIRSAIPVLPIPAAVVCLLINIVLPGFGTALSGVSVLCCGTPRLRAKGDTRSVTCCINLSVGFCQLCTITLCFVGWAWSLAWGILLVHFAVHYHRQKKQRRQVELQALALKAFTTTESGRKPFPF